MKYATLVTLLSLVVGVSAEGVLESQLSAKERPRKVDCSEKYESDQQECVKLDDLAQDRTSRQYGEDLGTCPKEETPSRWDCQDEAHKRMQTRRTLTQENWYACLDKTKVDYDRCMRK
ncbi:MAG: hypothetical protein WCV90_07515 [Candidatus Woesearchaeota archaeon]|jgi:hypothetical protein